MRVRLGAVAPALVLLLALASGGIRGAEVGLTLLLAVVAVAAWVGAGTPGTERGPTADPRVFWGAVGVLVVGFVARAIALPTEDQPIGTDWFAYLKNALALAEGDWESWHRWRGPLHAAACVVLTPVAGGLVEASQLLALSSLAATLPMTAWLVARATRPAVGLGAAALLATWPDLLLFARASTPYALLTAVLLGAVVASVRVVDDRRFVPLAGLLLAATVLTDPRGQVLATCVWLGLAALRPGWRRVLGVGVVAVGVAGIVLTAFPVDLVPLAEQVGLQRDLNATGQLDVCRVSGGAFPTPAELVGPCARATLADNLARAQRVVPVSLAFVAALALLGLGRRTWLFLLPILPALPSLLLVRVMHRYGVPLAPFAVGLAAAALDRVVAPVPRGRALLLGALVAAAMVPWNRFDGTLLARAGGVRPEGGAAFGVVLGEDRGLVRVRRLLREAGDADPVVDCARAGLRMRLHPREVEEIGTGRADRQPARCRTLLVEGADRPHWLLITLPPGATIAPTWTTVYRWTRGDGEVVLLHHGDGGG